MIPKCILMLAIICAQYIQTYTHSTQIWRVYHVAGTEVKKQKLFIQS